MRVRDAYRMLRKQVNNPDMQCYLTRSYSYDDMEGGASARWEIWADTDYYSEGLTIEEALQNLLKDMKQGG